MAIKCSLPMVFTIIIDLYKVYETLDFGLKTEYSREKRGLSHKCLMPWTLPGVRVFRAEIFNSKGTAIPNHEIM